MRKTESKKRWEWEYHRNPDREEEVLLAADKEQIVGYYAVIPWRMRIQNRQVIGTLSLDTMVYPDYRGQRIFTTLASSLYKDLGKRNMTITYGFPNENSRHGIFNKLNWTEISDLHVLQKTFNFEKVISNALKSNISKIRMFQDTEVDVSKRHLLWRKKK